MTLDFSVIERAGISKTELATITGVSRTSVQNWTKKSATPSVFVARVIGQTLADLQRAVDQNLLPDQLDGLPPSGPHKETRLQLIKDILAQVRRQDAHLNIPEEDSA